MHVEILFNLISRRMRAATRCPWRKRSNRHFYFFSCRVSFAQWRCRGDARRKRSHGQPRLGCFFFVATIRNSKFRLAHCYSLAGYRIERRPRCAAVRRWHVERRQQRQHFINLCGSYCATLDHFQNSLKVQRQRRKLHDVARAPRIIFYFFNIAVTFASSEAIVAFAFTAAACDQCKRTFFMQLVLSFRMYKNKEEKGFLAITQVCESNIQRQIEK